MRPTRLLPPLVLLAVLGAVAWSASRRPGKERDRRDIQIHWEDTSALARERLIEEVRRYADHYTSPDDRAFAALAFLRARDPASAFRVRWPDLERELPREEVRAFAEQALFALGWEDEALTRPSPTSIQCLLALVEGGSVRAVELLEGRIAREPIEDLYVSIRRSMGMPSREVRAVVSRACRARAQADAAQGLPALDWEVAAALLSADAEPYPEREADVALLRRVVGGTWRAQFPPRWAMACRSLAETGDPEGVEQLRRVLAEVERGTAGGEERDTGVLRAALLAGGDWTQEPLLRTLSEGSGAGVATVRVFFQDALLTRWRRGDARADAGLGWFWRQAEASGEGAGVDRGLALRERLGRLMLLQGPPPGPAVPVDRMLADLEAPGQPPGCVVIAKAYRVRRGDPGAREGLIGWLAGNSDLPLVGQGLDAERALAPPIAGLRALYVYR